ncbi:hypothetical protein K3G63_15595 [Hymenobacter sp. HSC-4F20]|uniref:hypothetical protein n=1 Tax=Hymenobacter sp. HSC-4F20 TaxID=2864135 RepID=UPI001C72C10E|nr:hypothetical protein [Hymenobacter sp. HSC-4F20]MBX0291876.1 hypothetical protein [Hymenobacter sp. HSC-4F20]
MTLYNSSDASITYHPASDTLHLHFTATRSGVSFRQAYQQALKVMLAQNVGKLLLDLKRNISLTEETELLHPLATLLPQQLSRPLFIAAVVSEGQYRYQIGSSLASYLPTPAQVEFNYFTSRRDATAWLNEN